MKLSQRPKVFSTHEWDVWLATGVEHQIQIKDDRPFREQSRHIALTEVKDVRKHL